MVPRRGIEPRTQGFSVPCSTDWAIWAQMAEVTRLELATSCVTGKHSNQLSYTSINGGHNWARTNDPLLVRQVLSQLSYATTSHDLISILYFPNYFNYFFQFFLFFLSKHHITQYFKYLYELLIFFKIRFFRQIIKKFTKKSIALKLFNFHQFIFQLCFFMYQDRFLSFLTSLFNNTVYPCK